MASLITPVVPRAAWPAAFETRPARASAAIGTSATAVWTASAAAATAPKWPLETRTRIAADARGVTGEILARSRGAAGTRRPSLAGEENHIVFDNRGGFRDGFASRCGKHFFFDMLGFDVFVFDMFLLAVPV